MLVDSFGAVAEGTELWELLDGKGFSADLVEGVMKELVDCVGTHKKCVEAPRVYQVTSLMREGRVKLMIRLLCRPFC
jgi:hypothetical protein